MTRAVGKSLLFLALFTGTGPLLYPQTQDRSQSEEAIKLSTELVLLDVQVLNRDTGLTVGGFTKENFVLTEDGVKQEITHFSQDKLPLSIVLLLDLSGSVQPIIEQIGEGALHALQHLKPGDEVALMAFATKTELVQDFTTDRQLIADKIQRINQTVHVGKNTFLNEAVYQAAVHLHKTSTPIGRRVLIVITDNMGTQPFFMGHSEKEALEQLLEPGSVVCGLIVRRFLEHALATYHPGVFIGRKLLLRGSLNGYAKETGGEVMSAKKEEVEAKLTVLMDHLRARYTLGYIPSNTKRDGTFQRIKLELSPDVVKSEGKLVIRTRRGYYARKPGS